MASFSEDEVIIYSHHAPPHPSASATRMVSLADHLRSKGAKVTFLTSKAGPSSYNGYSIIRCRGRIGLVANLTKRTRSPILISSPPATPSAEVAIAARALGYHVVVDVRDPYVSEALKNGEIKPGIRSYIKLLLEKSLFRSAHSISYVSEPLRDNIHESFGLINRPEAIAANGVDTAIFYRDMEHRNAIRSGLKITDEALFVYAGILGGKSLDKAFSAIAPALRSGCRLLMIAVLDDFSRPVLESLQAQAEALGISDRIDWRFNLTLHDVAKHLNACDIGLNPLPFNRSYCLPVKTFEYLACGVYPLNVVGKDSALRTRFGDKVKMEFFEDWGSFSARTLELIKELPELRAGAESRANAASLFDRNDANTVLATALLPRHSS